MAINLKDVHKKVAITGKKLKIFYTLGSAGVAGITYFNNLTKTISHGMVGQKYQPIDAAAKHRERMKRYDEKIENHRKKGI